MSIKKQNSLLYSSYPTETYPQVLSSLNSVFKS